MYTIDDIKYLLSQNNYTELNRAIKNIINNSNVTPEDIEILDFLSKNELIHEDSRAQIEQIKQQKEAELNEFIESAEKEEAELLDTVETSEEFVDEGKSDIQEIIDSVESQRVETPELSEEELVEQQEQLEEAIEESEETLEPIEESPIYSKVAPVEEMENSVYDEGFKNKLTEAGLTVKEMSLEDGFPRVTFEMNNNSKPFIDNMMLNFYEKGKPGIGFDLTKVGATKEELFTIYYNGKDLTPEELINGAQEMVNSIENVVDKTNKERDYEELLPDSVKNLKSQFVNDAPEVPTDENYRIGYVNENGRDNYYLMAGDKQTAIRLTEEMGFKPRSAGENGVVKIDTEENMMGTKLDQNSETMESANNKLNRDNEFDTDNYYNNNYENANEEKTNALEKPKVLVYSRKEAAFLDFKTVVLIIFLIIAVMIAVYLMG